VLPGRVVEVCVRENDAVAAGTVLLKLDDEVAQFQVQEACAALQAAEAQHVEASKAPEQHQFLLAQQAAALAAAQHDLAAARLIATQKEHLFKGKFLAREEVDAALELVAKLIAAGQPEQAKLGALKLRDPVQEVKRALADVTAKKALLNKARYALKETVLKAPSDGTVLRILVNPGEVLGPQPKQPAVLFVPREPRIVRAELEQEFAGRVFVGQRAVIRDDAGNSGATWQGSVARLSEWYANRRMALPDTLPVQEVRTLECIIQVDPNQAPLRIGQRVRVALANE